ncbi:hypothetical protein [Klebsiella pneumoniae]|uniref:hypothetical protein n=1 Tax=Klebsiella pneumoniae TaxID=573 RepID=UPI0034D319B0
MSRISARTLREMGFEIPAHIPDCATCSAASLNAWAASNEADIANNILKIDMVLDPAEFSWVEVAVQVTGQGGAV